LVTKILVSGDFFERAFLSDGLSQFDPKDLKEIEPKSTPEPAPEPEPTPKQKTIEEIRTLCDRSKAVRAEVIRDREQGVGPQILNLEPTLVDTRPSPGAEIWLGDLSRAGG